MKFSSAIIGGQLLLAATIYANPIADTANGLVAARSPAAIPAAIPWPSKERGPDDDGDVTNGVCLKLKREAEAAAHFAAEKSALYEKAVAKKRALKQGGVLAREFLPGKIKERGPDDDEAILNTSCAKLKREAEAAAHSAAEKSALYEKAVAKKRALKKGGVIAREVLPGNIKERGPDDDDEAIMNQLYQKL